MSELPSNIEDGDASDVINFRGPQTFCALSSKTIRVILLLLLHCRLYQVTGVRLLKSLRSWYFFVNMIGQVSQDAHTILN